MPSFPESPVLAGAPGARGVETASSALAPVPMLRILLLEDEPADADAITRTLRQAGTEFVARRVDTRSGFIEALESFAPDIVLADWKLPDISGTDALAHVRRVHPEIPVIVVTGELGDDAAVELLRAGAADYMLKSDLVRLSSSIEREISIERGMRARSVAEQATRESDAKLRALVEQNIVGVAIVHDDGIIAYVNPYFARLIDYPSSELRGRPLLDFVPEDERQATSAKLAGQISGEASFVQHESAITSRNGRRVEVLINATRSIFDGRRASIAVVIDITERKRASEALRASEAKYRGLFEATQDAITIFDAGAGKAIAANHAALMLFGATDEAGYLSRKPWEWSPELQPDGRPSADKARELFDAVMREGSRFFEWTHRRLDGSEFPADVLLTRVSRGKDTLIYSTVRDTTKRRQAEEKSREEDAKFRSLVEQNVAGIVIIREGGAIGYVNPSFAATLGGKPSDVIGRPLADFVPAAEMNDLRKQLAEHLGVLPTGSGPSMQRESLMQTLDGREIEVLVNASRSIFEGRPASLAVVLDVTEQRKAQRELAFNAAVLAAEQDVSPDGILVVDRAARIISVNARFGEIFRMPQQLIADKADEPVLKWVTDQTADATAFLQRVQDLYAHPTETSHEEVALKDGRVLDRHSAPLARPDGEPLGRIWFFRDISESKATERTLRRLNRALRTLSAGNEALMRMASEAELFQEICRILVEVGGYPMAWIGRADENAAKSVTPVAWKGQTGDYLEKAQIVWADGPHGQGPTGQAIRTGKIQVAQDIGNDLAMAPWQADAARQGYASSVALPLSDGSRIIAALTIYASGANAFDADELSLLGELANDLAFGIRSMHVRAAREALDRRWRASLEATIGSIASTVEMRDAYTAGHQRRVAQLAVAIGHRLKMADHDIRGLYLAGVIHDVGKIIVPAEILNKPGKLSSIEFQLIKEHAQAGYDIVKGVDFPWPIAEIVRQHHERIDGSGYPRGLKGDEILTQAKILAVADVVEAMMSHRPYRASLGIDAALAEIEKNRGSQFDPGAVDACIALFREKLFSFDQQPDVAKAVDRGTVMEKLGTLT